jgi:hypothetical protein
MTNHGKLWRDGRFAMTVCLASLGGMVQSLPVRAATVEVQITDSADFRAGEPEIAVNPKNPKNIAYFVMTRNYSYKRQVQQAWSERGYIDCYLAVSFDRGKTWTRVRNPFSVSRLTLCGDPMISFGPDGTLFAAADGMGVDPGRKDAPTPIGEVTIARSSDGGLTWTNPVITGTPIDRPWMSIDQSDGTIYLSSSCAGPQTSYCEANTRYIISSKDKGATWLPRVPIDSPEFPAGRGGSISAARGTLAVAYVSPKIEGRSCPCLIFATTTDTARNWRRIVVPSDAPLGSQAQVAADPSHPGQFVVAVLAPERNHFLIFSTANGGVSWSKPIALTNDLHRGIFKPWVGFSPNGVFGIFWRSSEAEAAALPSGPGAAPTPNAPATPPKTYPYDVWAAISRDGGKTVTQPLKISGQKSPAPDPEQQSTDDVSFIVMDGTDAHFGWGDWRSGEMQGWYARTPLADFK